MITPQTTGILAVHVFGTPCDIAGIREIADRYGLRVIYDAAHAFGAEIDGSGIGTFGDISMFSFHATKLFHTAEGGALTFKDENLKKRIDLLKNFGIKNEEEVVMPGINGKMNEIQAALGLVMLDYIDREKERRAAIAKSYRELLRDCEGIVLPPELPETMDSRQYFVIRINQKRFGISRDTVYERFKKFNVFTRKYFYPLCSDYTCYKQLPSSSPDNLPAAKTVVTETLVLPFYGGLSISDVERICNIFKNLPRQ